MDSINEIKNRCMFRLKDSSERLDEELDWFSSYGGSKLLIVVSNMVRDIKKSGLFVGCGQGYACSSLVCYGLGITDVDPVKWNMPFSTFTRHFMEEPVFYINTSKGGSSFIDGIRKYSDYPELVKIEDSVAEMTLVYDKGVDTCIVVINEYPELEMLKAFQGNRATDIHGIVLDPLMLASIVDEGVKYFTKFSHEGMKERVKEFSPECFSDLCVLEAMYRPSNFPGWGKVLEAKQSRAIPSTGNAEVDRILMESYGQLLYEEQLDAINDLKQTVGASAIEAALGGVEHDEGKLASKGTVIANALEAVWMKAFERKQPARFNDAAAPLVEQRRAERIRIIKAARERIRKQHE